MSDIRYEVTKKMAVLSANERTGWTKEVKKEGFQYGRSQGLQGVSS